MEKRDKAEELVNSLRDYSQLEEVPADVSSRYQESLATLVLSTQVTQKKQSWFSGSNQFALAASFTLVFALGAVFTMNLDAKSGESVSINQGQSPITPEESDVKEDQLLYSTGMGSLPKESTTPIKVSNSSQDYSSIPKDFATILNAETTWNSSGGLDPKTLNCLKSLQLDKSTNLIDAGTLEGKAIQAIWVPLTSSSWNVYLVDAECSVLQKQYILK